MLVVAGQKLNQGIVGDKTMAMVADLRENNGWRRTTALLQKIRKQKVLTVRQQLTQGKYDLNGRLDLVIDRLLEDIVA